LLLTGHNQKTRQIEIAVFRNLLGLLKEWLPPPRA